MTVIRYRKKPKKNGGKNIWIDSPVRSLTEKMLKAYATAVNFLKSSRSDKGWEEYLYYPLRSEWLDDVTVLFMLPISYELAEKWMKKRKLSKEDVKDYLNVFDAFVQKAQKRSENNTLTRDKDYTLQEFSDPVYLASYTEDLKQRWKKLI